MHFACNSFKWQNSVTSNSQKSSKQGLVSSGSNYALTSGCFFSDPAKKRSNFLCSIICCLGKRGSKHKNKDKEVIGVSPGSGDVPDSGGGKTPKAPQKALLPEARPEEADKKCIVIDLDETLVHSSFKVLLNNILNTIMRILVNFFLSIFYSR